MGHCPAIEFVKGNLIDRMRFALNITGKLREDFYGQAKEIPEVLLQISYHHLR